MRKTLDVYDNLFIWIFFGTIINYFWILIEIIYKEKNPNEIDTIVFIFFLCLLEIIFNCYGKFEVGFHIKNKFLFSLWDSEIKIRVKPTKNEFSKIIKYTFLKSKLYVYKRSSFNEKD